MKQFLAEQAEYHPLIAFILFQMMAALVLIAAVTAFTCICAVPVYMFTKLV